MDVKKISAVDKLLGKKIKETRKNKKVSVVKLAKSLGVSEQQVFKYESGINRISVSRLYQIAKVLEVSIQELIILEYN